MPGFGLSVPCAQRGQLSTLMDIRNRRKRTHPGRSGSEADRLRAGAEYAEPFLASLIPGRAVKTFSRHALRKPFRTACKVLGAARLESLTIHHGRHTFISHALAGGRTLAEVRDAAGYANVSITSGYLHVVVDDEAAVGSLFRVS
jgi:integrase